MCTQVRRERQVTAEWTAVRLEGRGRCVVVVRRGSREFTLGLGLGLEEEISYWERG